MTEREPGRFKVSLALAAAVLLLAACIPRHSELSRVVLRQHLTVEQRRLTLKQPRDLTVDSHGRVFVADTGHNRILKLSPQGRLLAIWGRSGRAVPRTSAQMRRWGLQLRGPDSIAIDPRGNVYVADTLNRRVQKISAKGRFLASWPCPDAPKLFPCSGYVSGPYFGAPLAVSVSRYGDVYVLDMDDPLLVNYDRVEEFNTRGSPKGAYDSSSRGGGIGYPSNIAVDRRGNLLVLLSTAGYQDETIAAVSPNGKTIRRWPVPDSMTGGAVAADSHDTLYLLSAERHRVYVFDSRGRPLRSWGLPRAPHRERLQEDWRVLGGIAIDGKGSVYISDVFADRIYKYTTGGRLEATWLVFRP